MGKGGNGVSSGVSAGEQANSNALIQIAQAQQGQSSQLFSSAFPGFQQAEQYQQSLASGDPYAISRAIAPAAQQADTAAGAAKANILNTGPAGGEKTLALEQVDVNRGAQVGQAATSGYTNSFGALASLAGQGVGESQSAAGLGISGLNSSSQTLGTIGSQQIQAQQLQQEQKGNTLGALGSLGGDAATLLTGGISPSFGGGGGESNPWPAINSF